MIELADIATLAFIASGVTYQSVKYWRSDKRVRLKREQPVSLVLREMVVPESITHAVVVVFDRRGCLVRKFPEKEIIRKKKYCKLSCSSAEGRMDFCVLFTSCTLSLSGIHRRTDIDRQFAGIKDLLIAETGLQEISHGASFELTLTSGHEVATDESEATPTALSMLLPGTDDRRHGKGTHHRPATLQRSMEHRQRALHRRRTGQLACPAKGRRKANPANAYQLLRP